MWFAGPPGTNRFISTCRPALWIRALLVGVAVEVSTAGAWGAPEPPPQKPAAAPFQPAEPKGADAAEKASGAPVRLALTRNAYGKLALTIDKKPVSLFWAFGLDDPADLDAYAETGFNTVWIPLPWREANDWPKVDALIQGAAERGLWVILALETGRPESKKAVRVTTSDGLYRQNCAARIEYLVKRFVDTPNLIAWATQDDPVLLLRDDDRAFQAFLASRYPSVGALAQAWNAPIRKLDQVTTAGVPRLDHGVPPFFARPSLDLLLYRWQEFFALESFWATAIRRFDKRRLLFTGRLRDYKELISVPPQYNGVIPELIPGVVEADWLTHNPHGIDIARRGGTFCAYPSLSSGQAGKPASAAQLARWMETAVLHGASGLCLTDWKPLKGADTLRQVVRRLWDRLRATQLMQRSPLPSAAVLYEPTGEGFIAHNRPLYGYGQRFSPGEPSDLIYTFHHGTRYGQMDYLGIDSLSRGDVDLPRYGVLLAPLALTVDEAAQQTLVRYVSNGGVLVADLGFGMAEGAKGGRTMGDLPPLLQRLVGNYGVQRFITADRNMSVVVEHPLFPSLRRGQYTRGTAGGAAFSGAMGRSRKWRDAITFGLVFPGTRGAAGPGAVALTINPVGRGYALYAPFRLWANWLVYNQLWVPFHADLLRRNAGLVLQNAGANLISDTLEVAAFREAVAVNNLAGRAQLAVVDAVTANNLLLTDCVATVFGRNYPLPNTFFGYIAPRLGRTPLARLVGNEQRRPQRLYVTVPGNGLRACRMSPVEVEPSRDSCVVQLLGYGKEEVRLRVYGPRSRVEVQPDGSVKVHANRPGRARVLVYPGTYPVSANSAHAVTLTDLVAGKSQQLTTHADKNGLLTVDTHGRAVEVVIRQGDTPPGGAARK